VSYARTGGGQPGNDAFSVSKDSVAPTATPSADVAPGSYTSTRTVTFSGEPGSTVRWTNDGSDPTAASASGPATVANTQTIKARQFDAAGNPGPVGTYAYTIAPAPAQQQQSQQQAPAVQQPLPLSIAPKPLTPVPAIARASALSISGNQKLSTVRRNGLRYKVKLANGSRFVRVRLVKVSGNRKTRVKQAVVRVTQAGTHTGRLRGLKRLKAGRYQLQVANAGADRNYSTATTKSLRIAG
jgi:hypothetical protein